MWLLTFDFWPGWSWDWLAPAAVAASRTEISHCKFQPFIFFLSVFGLLIFSLLVVFFAADVQQFKKRMHSFSISSSASNSQESHFALVWPHSQTLFLQVCPTCLSVGIITGNWDGGMWGKRSTRRKQLPMFPSAAVTATSALKLVNGGVTSAFMACRGNKGLWQISLKNSSSANKVRLRMIFSGNL